MKKENQIQFFEDIKGTFFERILDVPMQGIEQDIGLDDVVIGSANLFEKKCFLFYLNNNNPKIQLSHEERLKSEMRALTAIGIMRSNISDRFKLENQVVHRIWIRKGDNIVVAPEQTSY